MKTLIKLLFMKQDSIDIKSVIILVLFIASSIFFTQWYFGGESHKKEIKMLEKQNEQLQKQKEKLEEDFTNLRIKFEKDSSDLVIIKSEILILDKKIKEKDLEILRKNRRIKKFKDSMAKTRSEIEELKANPVRRTGNNLLESIKEKTK